MVVYLCHLLQLMFHIVLLFIPDGKISKFKHWNIEALKKEVELAAMAAKSKESPSQARQIVSTNCIMINELLLVMKST